MLQGIHVCLIILSNVKNKSSVLYTTFLRDEKMRDVL